jgi:hypothetical protein
LALNLADATSLVEKMASNQSWNEERVQPRKRGGGMHQLDEKKEVMHIHDSRMTCKECGDTGHSGSNCHEL